MSRNYSWYILIRKPSVINCRFIKLRKIKIKVYFLPINLISGKAIRYLKVPRFRQFVFLIRMAWWRRQAWRTVRMVQNYSKKSLFQCHFVHHKPHYKLDQNRMRVTAVRSQCLLKTARNLHDLTKMTLYLIENTACSIRKAKRRIGKYGTHIQLHYVDKMQVFWCTL